MSNQSKILMTGATGFAGSNLSTWFLDRGYHVVAPCRSQPVDERLEFYKISRIDRYTFWADYLKGVDAVVHLAGRAHQLHERSDSHYLYCETNVEGTVNLALQAASSGVRRFIFISSIKAMISDASEIALSEKTLCSPLEPYGLSKLKAEIELRKISAETGMQLVILRPPLIYGPGVKGNFASLQRLVQKLSILPLGGLTNRRSLLAVKNLASAVETALYSDKAVGQTYLLSDGEEVSTSELVARMAAVFNPACRIVSLPRWVWRLGSWLPMVAHKMARLNGSLPVDSGLFTRETGWRPVVGMQEQLLEMLDR
ncbi:MAG: NAD-dependent epimerase/dehydratase family protein [Candidatus Riflebacteria bacterium]|nr:NAD-dependent epimerase/dehydratase family protein [Candidatus Riflebacteria bacterium]